MKKNWKSILTVVVTIVTLSVLFTTACNIGLGSQVDVDTPEAAITYPDPESIIRGTFVIEGSCSDDMGVKTVTVTLGKPDSTTGAITLIGAAQTATIDNDGAGNGEGKWHITIDPTSFSDTTLKDGSYIATAIASDGYHSSSKLSLAFSIDNTAPVFIIKSPSSETISNATPYGRKFKISGDVSDDHIIKQMNIGIFDTTGKQIGKTIQFTNVESSSISAGKIIAQYSDKAAAYIADSSKPNPGADLVNLCSNYLSIYTGSSTGTIDSNATLSDKNCYCIVQLIDNARQYTNNDTDSTEGNATTYYYSNDAIYDALLGTDGYSLSVDDIKKMLNGTYSGTLNETQIADVKTQLANAVIGMSAMPTEIDVTDTKLAVSAFSLNPDAAPRYDIIGCTLTSTGELADTVAKNLKSVQTTITYTATAGRDSVAVKPWTFVVNLYKVSNGLYDINTPTIVIANSDYSEAKGSTTSYTGSFTIPESYTDTSGVKQFLSPGDQFVIEIAGEDQEGEDLYSDTKYGFQIAATGNPPTLTFGATDISTKTNLATTSYSNDASVTTSATSIKYSGTASTDSSSISSVKVAVTISDNDSANNLFPVSAETESTSLTKSSTNTAGTKTYTWSVDLASILESLSAEIKTALDKGNYTYTVTVTATDSTGLKSSKERLVYVDTVKPSISFNAITPTTEFAVSGTTYTCINGIITLSGSLDEANTSELYYKVISDGTTVYQKIGSTYTDMFELGNGKAWTKSGTFDTTTSWYTKDASDPSGYSTFTCTDHATLKVEVYAEDKAGNADAQSLSYRLEQASDSPIFAETPSFKNGIAIDGVTSEINLYDTSTAGSVMTAQIADDDSINQVTYSVYTYAEGASATDASKYTNLIEANSATVYPNKSPYTLNIQLPSTEGMYRVVISVTDTKEETTYGTAAILADTFVAVDTGVPTITLDKSSGAFVTTNPVVKITTEDSAGVAKLERYTLTKEENGSFTQATSPDSTTFSLASGCTLGTSTIVTATNTIVTEQTGFKRYIVYDKYGRKNSVDFGWLVDTKHPTFTVDTAGGSSYSSSTTARVFNMSNTYQITGKVVDAESSSEAGDASQIKGMYYKVAQSAPTSTTYYTDDMTESNGWYAATLSRENAGSKNGDTATWAIYVAGTGLAENDTYTVYLAAVDNAGYVSLLADNTESAKISVIPDKTAPSYAVKVNGTETGTGVAASWQKNTINVIGTLTEVHLASFSVQTTQDGASKSDYSFTDSDTGKFVTKGGGTYEFTIPQISASGNWSFTVTTTDKAGLSATWIGSAKIDNEGPSITLDNLAANTKIFDTSSGYADGKYTVSGSCTDTASGLSKLYYSNASTAPSDLNTENSAMLAGGWTEITVSEGSFSQAIEVAEDTTLISFAAVDAVGNVTTLQRAVTVDTSVPTVNALTKTIAQGTATATTLADTTNVVYTGKIQNISVTTTVTDTKSMGSVDKVTATAMLGSNIVATGNKNLTIVKTLSGDNKTVNVTFTLAVPVSGGTDDGTWTFSVTGTDALGRAAATTATTTIKIDTVKPTLVVNSPVANKVYTENDVSLASGVYKFTANGTWSDATSGTSKLQYTTKASPAAADWNTASTTAASGVTLSWTATISVQESSGNTISFRAIDAYGNTSTVITASGITFDFSIPTITLDSYNAISNAATYILTGSVSDALALDTTTSPYGLTITATKGGVDATASLGTIAYTPGTKTTQFSIPVTASDNNGKWIFTIAVTDKAGRSATTVKTDTVIIDTAAPSFENSTSYPFAVGGKTYTTNNWYNDTSLSFTGYYNEDAAGSGIKTVYYWQNKVANTADLSSVSGTITPNSSTGTCKFNATIDYFDNNSDANTIYFAAVDEAGNISTASGPYAIKVDSGLPIITPESTGTVLSNAGTALSITGTVSDTASGVDTGTGKITATAGTISYTSGTTYTLALPTTVLSGLSNGINVINATVKDKAGNSYTGTIATINIDKTVPTVTYATPASNATVNKKITISGTASDNNALVTGNGKGTLYIKKGSGTANSYTVNIATDGSWSYTLDTFTSTYFNSTTSGTITWYLVVTDSAGNSSATTNTRTVTVDQNADRPAIKVTNIDKDAGVLKYGTKAQMTGTVTDDDSTDTAVLDTFIVSSGKITALTKTNATTYTATVDGATGKVFTVSTTSGVTTYTNATYGTTTFTSASGDWIYQPGDVADGTKTVYFYAIDKASAIFYTAQSTLAEPKIQFKTAAATDNGAAITYVSDSVAPAFTSTTAYYGTAGSLTGSPTALSAALYVGGTSRNTIKFSVAGSDNNGIAGFTLLAKDSAGAPICSYTSAATIVGETMSGTVAGTFANPTTTTGTFVTPEVTLAGFATGAATVTVYIYDKSGIFANTTVSFSLDNTGPSVNVTTPSQTEEVTGKLSMAGSATDADGAGTASIQWAVPTSTQRTNYTTDAQLKANLSWKGTLASGKTAMSWQFDFDGSNNDNFTMYDTADYYTAYSDGIYTLPVYFLATDNFGNYSVKKYSIQHNPNADKPVTVIGFPTENDYDSGVSFTTRNGVIAVTGSATDNTSVNKVFLQIATSTYSDGTYTYDWTNSSGVASNYGLTVVKATDAASGILTSNSNCWTSETTVANWWGIAATRSSSSWHINLNADGKMNPTGSTPTGIKIRACAVDENGLLGAWSSVYEIHISNSVPAMDVTLNQYASGTEVSNVSSKTATASRTYVTDMYLKGTWWLKVYVSDTSGINADSSSVYRGTTILTNGTDYARVASQIGTSGKYNYYYYIPINTSVEGSVSYKIISVNASGEKTTTTYTMNVDNTAPTIASLLGNSETITTSTPIVNSNYTYTLSGSVTEAGSGFDRLMFFFLRDTVLSSGTERLYDPYIANSSINESAMDSMTYTYDSDGDGTAETYTMWGESCTEGTMGTTTTFTATTPAISGNAHIRKGGLIYIGGSFHLITAVSGNVVTFEGETPTTNTTAFFPYAQIVDNTKSEKTAWDTNTHRYTFTTPDDDGMPETVTKGGSTWRWDATIYSDNIPDGPITLVVFALDQAGNIAATKVATKIENNPPKLAKVYLGTDLDGSGTYTDNEFNQYDMYYVKKGSQSSVALTTKDWPTLTASGDSYESATRDPFIVKDKLAVVPEFTGGNGTIKMVYQRPAQLSGTALTTPTAATGTGANLRTADVTVSADPSTSATISGATLAKLSGSSMNAYVLNNAAITGATLTGDTVTVGTYDGTDKAMSFTFWDSTDELTCGMNSQKCVLLVTDFTVDLFDQVAPTATINPFYWKNKNENSVTKATTTGGTTTYTPLGGHIDFETPNAVSGTMIVEGSAFDESRIIELDMFISSYKMGRTAVGNSTGAVDTAVVTVASLENNVLTSKVSGFVIDSNTLVQSGNTVTWHYTWNSALIENVAAKNVVITVSAKDRKTNPATATTKSVDVVPYITSVVRNDAVHTMRSRLGKYPVAAGETGLILSGYNLPGTTANAILMQTTANKTNAVATTYKTRITATAATGTSSMTFTAPIYSGYLQVATNSVVSNNNRNDNSAQANIEAGNDVTDSWTDDRYLSVWRTGEYFPKSDDPISPAMDKEGDGTLLGGWATNGSRFYASTPVTSGNALNRNSPGGSGSTKSGTDNTEGDNYMDPPTFLDVVEVGGEAYWGLVDCWQGSTSRWGSNGIFANRNGRFTFANGSANDEKDSSSLPWVFERMGMNTNPSAADSSDGIDDIFNQFLNPRITATSGGVIYMTYYDRYAKCLKYGTSTIATDGGTPSNQYVTEAKTGNTHHPSNATGTNVSDNYINGACVVAGFDTTVSGGSLTNMNVGEWSAPGYDTTQNAPVIAYYNGSSKTLWIATASGTATAAHPTNTNTPVLTGTATSKTEGNAWTRTQVTTTERTRLGQYVSLAVDGGNNLHIACFDGQNGNLYYIFGKRSSYGNYTFFPVCVDSNGSVGNWTDIQLTAPTANGLSAGPVISYLSATDINTQDGLKVAYITDATAAATPAANVTSTILTSSIWDCITAPAATEVTNSRATLALGAKDTASVTNKLAVGYVSSRFDVIYLRDEQ